jgi:hypothetical protein
MPMAATPPIAIGMARLAFFLGKRLSFATSGLLVLKRVS